MSATDNPSILAFVVAADLVEWVLNRVTSIPAEDIIFLSQFAMVQVLTGLCGGTVPNRSLCCSLSCRQCTVRLR